jgi:hypothetical protein
MRRRSLAVHLLFALVVGGLTTTTYSSGGLPAPVEQAVASITAEDLRAHVRFLASDELQGRGAGHNGNQVAELYLASVFERLQLGRATGVAYLQPVELVFSKLGQQNALTLSEQVNKAAVDITYSPGSDFYPHPASASRAVTAGLVFAGYGITASDLQYDDYASIDVAGRIVVAFDGEPQTDDKDGRFLGRASTPYADVESKMANARKHGAVGLLIVRQRLRDVKSVWPENPSVRARSFQLADQVQEQTLPVGVLSMGAAGTVLGSDASKLKSAIDQRLESAGTQMVSSPAAFVVDGRQARLSVDLTREPVVVHNVVGMIEGSDPKLKQQVVVVGGHMDHDGIDAEGRVFNGADDNASGTAGVLETAEAFATAHRAGVTPSRTVVFALWNAEEKGELGSEYYVRHPAPSGELVANLNMDMIGRNEDVPDPNDFRFAGLPKTTAAENNNTVHLLGYSFSEAFARLVEQENAAIGLKIEEDLDVNPQNLIRRSDQWPFLQQHVPAIFLTTGLHPDYHTPQDDVGRINFDKLEKIARLAFRVTWRLATDSNLPSYVDPNGRRSTH